MWGKTHGTKTSNEAFQNVAKFKYIRMTVTNQNHIHNQIKIE